MGLADREAIEDVQPEADPVREPGALGADEDIDTQRPVDPSGARQPVRIRVAPRFGEQQARVRRDLDRIGRETFGENFNVELAESITAPEGTQEQGAYDPQNRIAYIAMRAEEDGMAGTLYHEGIHHLRNAGAFTDAEGAPNAAWKALERQAPKWRQDYGIDERYATEAGNEDLMTEEAIAEALADYATRGKETGFPATVRMAFDRVLRFFRGVANGLKGRGFKTWEDVFEGDVLSGEAGQRADATPEQRRAEVDRQLQTAWHGSPHRFDEFSTDAIGTGTGDQVFGFGLYFSGERKVAEHYRDTVGKRSIPGRFSALTEEENRALSPQSRAALRQPIHRLRAGRTSPSAYRSSADVSGET